MFYLFCVWISHQHKEIPVAVLQGEPCDGCDVDAHDQQQHIQHRPPRPSQTIPDHFVTHQTLTRVIGYCRVGVRELQSAIEHRASCSL